MKLSFDSGFSFDSCTSMVDDIGLVVAIDEDKDGEDEDGDSEEDGDEELVSVNQHSASV